MIPNVAVHKYQRAAECALLAALCFKNLRRFTAGLSALPRRSRMARALAAKTPQGDPHFMRSDKFSGYRDSVELQPII
jgi:hypothetical protein